MIVRSKNKSHVSPEINSDKNYIVYSVAITQRGILLGLVDEASHWYPYDYAASDFNIIDATIPDNWGICTRLDGDGNLYTLLSFPEMIADPEFFAKLVDSEKGDKMRLLFEGYMQKYNKLYARLLNS